MDNRDVEVCAKGWQVVSGRRCERKQRGIRCVARHCQNKPRHTLASYYHICITQIFAECACGVDEYIIL